MGVWQVSAVGWGFMKGGTKQDCEITGLVRADDPDDAFSRACAIAKILDPELLQAVGPFPRPVINAEEIQELPCTEGVDIDKVQVCWVEK
jgi:hypothetical protein